MSGLAKKDVDNARAEKIGAINGHMGTESFHEVYDA